MTQIDNDFELSENGKLFDFNTSQKYPKLNENLKKSQNKYKSKMTLN